MAPKKKPAAKRPAAAPAVADGGDGTGSVSQEQLRQALLLALERKFRALIRSAQLLNARLGDPAEPRAEIEVALAESGIERQAILARRDAIESGGPFRFPSEATLQDLRTTMAALESAIAQTAATEALILATSAVIQAFRAEST